MNKPTAVHRDGLKPRYGYDVGSDEDVPMLNAACGICGKRHYNQLGPKDGHIMSAKCEACEKRVAERRAAKIARNAEKTLAMYHERKKLKKARDAD